MTNTNCWQSELTFFQTPAPCSCCLLCLRRGRDKKIEDYKTWLRTLGGAGFHFTLSNFSLAQIVTSSFVERRGSRHVFRSASCAGGGRGRDCDRISSG